MFDLHGKRALVTGASGGLGAHFAQVLAAAGAEVILTARRREVLTGLADAIAGTGAKASAVALDVTDSASIAAALDEAGPIDILVNNAGAAMTKPVLDLSEADFDFVVNTNLRGAFLMATETARRMKARGSGGTIVNIASILGLRQGGQVTPYAISKAGIIQMTKQLALELARDSIRVNALAPGYIETDLNRDFFASEAGKALLRRIPQRRLGRMDELDGPLLLLASDASAYMTGSVVTVDGGHLVNSL